MPVSTMPLVFINASFKRLASTWGLTSPRSAQSPSDRLLGVENKALTPETKNVFLDTGCAFRHVRPDFLGVRMSVVESCLDAREAASSSDALESGGLCREVVY